MNKAKALKLSEKIWEIIGSSRWYDFTIGDLEKLLGQIESFEESLPKAYSDIAIDCTAQKSFVIMRQNYLATGKYYSKAF